jgi:hypothetical protein
MSHLAGPNAEKCSLAAVIPGAKQARTAVSRQEHRHEVRPISSGIVQGGSERVLRYGCSDGQAPASTTILTAF